jgi:DnaJ like chaperone protein
MEQKLEHKSLWARIADAFAAVARGEGLTAVFDNLRAPPERSVAFTIAVIALGAKMAKADGQVTRAEVQAFREVFHIPASEEANAARVFNIARQDVAGFDLWAKKIVGMFGPGAEVLKDILEGLFHIAIADGDYHEGEDAFLWEVARIFGLAECCFRGIRSRYVPDALPDPYAVLGLEADASLKDAKSAYRRAIIEAHPDRAIARGLPEEAVRLAEARVKDLTRAWDEIRTREAA